MSSPQRISRWLRWWLIGYAVLIASVIAAMFWARHTAITRLSSSQSISDWQAWRSDVQSQQGHPGPVERRVPKSNEPPALVLMRDYFGILMTGAMLFSSVLYWIIAWFVSGILAPPARPS